MARSVLVAEERRIAALTRMVAAMAALAVAMPAVALAAPPPAAAAVTGIAAKDAVLVPGTGYNIQSATLNAPTVTGEQFDVSMPEDIGVYVVVVMAERPSTEDLCQVAVSGQRWHCQTAAGTTRLLVEYQTGSMWVSLYPALEHSFPVTFTDTTTGAQATAHVTVQPSTDFTTYVGGIFPPNPAIDVEVMNHGPSDSSSATVVITVTGTYLTTSMPTGCASAGQHITCTIPQLRAMTDTHRLIPLAPGTAAITLTATVTAADHDPDGSNNSYTSGPWTIFVGAGVTDGNGNNVPPPGAPATHGPGPTAAAPARDGTGPAALNPTASDLGTTGSPDPDQSSNAGAGRPADASTTARLATGSTRPGDTAWFFGAAALLVLALLAGGLVVLRRHRTAAGAEDATAVEAPPEVATPEAT